MASRIHTSLSHPSPQAAMLVAALFLLPSGLLIGHTPNAGAQTAADYTRDEIPFAPINLTAGATTLTMADNEVTSAFELGFTTQFFGLSTNLFWVGSNGFVTLHFLTPDGCCGGDPIPTAGGPDGMIAALWTDLDPTTGGTIRFEHMSIGGAPGVVVDYDSIPIKGSTTQTVSFQIHILQSGVIETHYARFHSPLGLDVTVGLENIDGTRGLEVLHQAPGTGDTDTNVTLRFTPTNPPPATGDTYTLEEVAGGLVPFGPDQEIGSVVLSDDQVTLAIPMGFSTEFFGTSTSDFWISSNGFIAMHFQTGSGCCSGDPIPSNNDPNGIIAGFWSDLNPADGGTIQFQRTTLDGQPALLVSFTNVPFCCGNPGINVTFQIIVFQDGVIETRYGSNALSDGRQVSIGVENIDGTGGVQVPNVNGTEDFGNRAFRFTPLAGLAYDVSEIGIGAVALSGNSTVLSLADDFVTSLFPLGFSSEFFGTPTSEFWVGSNGFVTFHFLTPDGCCGGAPIPTPGGPEGMAAPFWTDLDPSAGGIVAFEQVTLGGQPALVVDYTAVPVKGTGDTVSFQLHFFEDASLELHYVDARIPMTGLTSIGLESIDASEGIEVFHGNNTTIGTGDGGGNNTTTTTTVKGFPITDRDLSGRAIRFVPLVAPPPPPPPAPELFSVDPLTVSSGTIATASGANFDARARLLFAGAAVDSSPTNESTLAFSVPFGLPNGFHSVAVRNSDGQTSNTLFIELLNSFGLQSVNPGTVRQGDDFDIVGNGFTSDTLVLLDGALQEDIEFDGINTIRVSLPIDFAPSIYDVEVFEPSAGTSTLGNALVVGGRPDVTTSDLLAERHRVRTFATPEGIMTPGTWRLSADIGNHGDLDADTVEVSFFGRVETGMGPLKDAQWERVDTVRIEGLTRGTSTQVTTEWDSGLSMGDHSFMAVATVMSDVDDRDASNNAASTTEYVHVGGLGGVRPEGCPFVVLDLCAPEAIRWEDHEISDRQQTDVHQSRSLRVDALMDSPDFSFNNFDLVFTTFETAPDGTFTECTTWRFNDRSDGFFRVTMDPGNGFEGTARFDGGVAFPSDGQETRTTFTQLVLDAGLREVVLFQTPPDEQFRGPDDATDSYTFDDVDDADDTFFAWTLVASGLTGDFTHCHIRPIEGGSFDQFTFAALPADVGAEVASFDGEGFADLTTIDLNAFTRSVDERPFLSEV